MKRASGITLQALFLLGAVILLGGRVWASPSSPSGQPALGPASGSHAAVTDVVAFVSMQKKLSGSVLEELISKQPLSNELLRVLDAKQLRVLRNTAFALGGARFRSKDLRAWFGKHDWYVPSMPASQVTLTPIARQNVTISKLIEKWYGPTMVGIPEDGYFQGYHRGVALFFRECDGECLDETEFVSIRDGNVIGSEVEASLDSEGRLHFLEQGRTWSPSEGDPGPSGWKPPDCREKEKALNPPGGPILIDCSTWFAAFIQLRSDDDLEAVLGTGLLNHPSLRVTPSWQCFCSS